MESAELRAILRDKKFFIPNYQRDYAWKKKNLDDLWEDLEESLVSKESSQDNKGHYLGTIVLAPHNQNNKEVDVIDGQQRLTTTFMILLALWEKLDNSDQEEEGRGLLFPNNKLRLQVSENNRVFLGKIRECAKTNNLPSEEQLGLEIDTQGKRNLYEVFEAILGKVKAFNEKEARKYFNKLLEMQLICFAEKSEGRAIRTFQSVNDRGVSLTLLDKLKALLIYYSNQYCEGEKGLDSEINECFGEIFRISNKILKHGNRSAFFRDQREKIDVIESNVFRYHIGSKKFVGESFSIEGRYDTSSETRYLELKDKIKTIAEQGNLKDFLKDYSEDLKKFFEAILRILDKINANPAIFKAIMIEKLHPIFYNTFVRLETDSKLNDEMITLFTKADCILKKFNDKKASPYCLILAYYETQDIELLKSKIYEICKNCNLENQISEFVKNTAIDHSFKVAFHYLFIEQKEKNLDIGHLKKFKSPTLEHIISQSVLDENDSYTINEKKFENPEDLRDYIHTYGNLLSLEGGLNEAARNRSDIDKKKEYDNSALPFVKNFDPNVVDKQYIITENDKMKRWLKEEFFKDFL